MREEEDIGKLERLVDVSVGHQLLVGESFVSFVLFESCVDLSRHKLGWLGDSLGYYALKVLYEVIE